MAFLPQRIDLKKKVDNLSRQRESTNSHIRTSEYLIGTENWIDQPNFQQLINVPVLSVFIAETQ